MQGKQPNMLLLHVNGWDLDYGREMSVHVNNANHIRPAIVG